MAFTWSFDMFNDFLYHCKTLVVYLNNRSIQVPFIVQNYLCIYIHAFRGISPCVYYTYSSLSELRICRLFYMLLSWLLLIYIQMIVWFLFANQLKVNLQTIPAKTNQLLPLCHLQRLAIQKVLHPLPTWVRNWKLLYNFENSLLMSLSQQRGILDLRVFSEKVGLVAYSRVGSMRMELLRWNLEQGLQLQ